MNRALLIVCFALSAIALALSLVPRGDPAPSPAYASASGVTADDLEILEKRIDAAEDLNRELLDKVTRLERAAPSLTFASDAGVSAAVQLEVAQLKQEVHGMIAGEALNSPGGKQYLRDTLRELQGEEQRTRMEQQLQRVAERAEEQKAQWKKFTSDAHLNYQQETALTQALDAETAKRKALIDEMRAGTKNFRDVGRDTRDLKRDTDKAVRATLDEAQAKQYDALRREQTRLFGGGDRGDRGGGDRGDRNRGP